VAQRKVDLKKLDRLLREGKTPTECAAIFDCSLSVVCRARKKLKNAIIKTVVMEEAHAVVEEHLDVLGQLRKINEAINNELDRAQEDAGETKGKDRLAIQDMIVRLSAEIRKQLNSQLEILKMWHDAKKVQEFQAEVLQILGEVDPEIRREIINRLKQRHAVRGLVKVD
jgi:hypothetical protein